MRHWGCVFSAHVAHVADRGTAGPPTGPRWPGHSVLVVPVPALERLVRQRTRHYDAAYLSSDPTFAHAHVTLLGPFVGASDLTASVRAEVRRELTETFGRHDSLAVQQTLHAMGSAVLERCGAIAEITLVLPNQHHLLANLAPFGLDNPNRVFVGTDEPFGQIEATLTR